MSSSENNFNLDIDLSTIEALNEGGKGSRSSDRAGIINSTAIIYAHIMKHCYISENKSVFGTKVTGWINTVYNQAKYLREITNTSHWNETLNDDKSFISIRNSAIDIFLEDNNKEYKNSMKDVQEMFNTLDSYFHNDIRGIFTNYSKLKAFLEATAQVNEQPTKADAVNTKTQFKTVPIDNDYYYIILSTWKRTIWY